MLLNMSGEIILLLRRLLSLKLKIELWFVSSQTTILFLVLNLVIFLGAKLFRQTYSAAHLTPFRHIDASPPSALKNLIEKSKLSLVGGPIKIT